MDEVNDLLVASVAAQYRLDTRLVKAIVAVESAGNCWATRYEKGWQWFNDPASWATLVGTSVDTEHVHQATSWGPMQIMGATARDVGFKGALPQLCVAAKGLTYGCAYLRRLVDKYGASRDDVVAAYNAGSPRRGLDGKYLNQDYVDRVVGVLSKGVTGCTV